MTAGRLQLRLLAQRLTPNDIAKIGVFLRVGQEKLACDWSMVSDGATDVLILSGNEPDTVLGLLENPRAILCVVDAPGDARNNTSACLVRPLQYEAFIEALLQVERVALNKGTAPAVTAPKLEPAALASPTVVLSPTAAYRLRRWPAADVLRGHRHHVRLASFLSTRHVALAELVMLSNLDEAECREFVARLLAADLLDMKDAAKDLPVTRVPGAPPRAASTASARSRPVDQGLIRRLRSVLGMGGSR